MPKSFSKKNLLFIFSFAVLIAISTVTVYFIDYIQWLFIGLVFLVLMLFALRFPFYSFLLFVIALPFEAAFVFEIGFTIRLSYILLAITILGLFFSVRKLHFKSALNIPIFVFLGISTLSLIMIIFSPPPEVNLAEIMEYRGSAMRPIIQLLLLFFFVAAYFLTIHFCSNKKKLDIILKTYIGIASLIALYGIYQFFTIKFNLPFINITNAISTGGHGYGVSYYNSPSLFRPHATFQEPLNFGHYLLSVLPFLIAIHLFRRKEKKNGEIFLKVKFLPVLILMMSFALFLTKSRGAWLGFLIALIFLLIMTRMKHKLKLIGFLILVCLIVGLFSFFYFPAVYQTIPQRFIYRFSLDPRLTYYSFIFNLWKQYPILGVGFGNYGWYAASYFSSSLLVSAHGVFQEFLIETGILGFLSLIFLVFIYYRIMFRALKKNKDTPWYPYILGFLACFTAMMVQYLTFGDRFSLYFWVLLGISIATLRLIKKEKILVND